MYYVSVVLHVGGVSSIQSQLLSEDTHYSQYCNAVISIFDFMNLMLFTIKFIKFKPAMYTLSQKTRHLTLAHNFTKYWPIFKIFHR